MSVPVIISDPPSLFSKNKSYKQNPGRGKCKRIILYVNGEDINNDKTEYLLEKNYSINIYMSLNNLSNHNGNVLCINS